MSNLQRQEYFPRTRKEYLFDQLRLAAIPGLGPILRRRLIGQFGSASRVLQESVATLEGIHGVGHRLASAISMSSTHDRASRILSLSLHQLNGRQGPHLEKSSWLGRFRR